MKTNRSIVIALTLLILASLGCGLLTGGNGEDSNQENPSGGQEPGAPQYEPGYEPGWRIFSNANYVNGITVHDGVLWAATEGGVVAWDLATDQYTKYTTLDGLGHLSAYDVVVCPMPEPTVVIATETGLSLYNIASSAWNTSPITPEDSHVSTNVIDTLHCDEQNGRLLIGYRGLGILDIESGAWQQVTEEDGLAWNGVDGLTVSGTDIWAGGYKGISVIRNGNIELYNEGTGMPDETSDALASTSDGTVWVATSAGLVSFQNGAMNVFTRDTTEGLPGSLDTLAAAPDGTVWTASNGSRLCQFNPAQKACVYTYEGSTDYYLIDIAAGNSGDVYYSTYGGGIWAYNGSEWRNLFIKEDQLAGNFVEAFVEDQNGLMWVATDKGAQRFDPKNIDLPWETYKAGENGPASDWAQGLFVGTSGHIWIANDSKRVSYFDGSNWSRLGPDDGIPGSVNSIAFDNDGVPYIGTGEGLLILNGGSQRLLTDSDGLPNKNVRSLLSDGDLMWIGTTNGLALLKDGKIETVLGPGSEGLPDDNISVIRKAADGSLILGTSDGLARYDGNQASAILEPQSTAGLFGEPVSAVSDVAIAPDGSIWVSTYTGLYHGDGQNWEYFTTANGLPARNLNAVFVDSTGVVWVGGGYTRSGGGIARFIPGQSAETNPEPQDANQSTDDNSSSGGTIQYDENTGLPLHFDAEQVYSTDSVLNYWSSTDFASLRDFYLTEMPNIGWLSDKDENGNCRDNDRCMGWSLDYDDPENQTFFFLKGEKGYITLNLIPENGKVNVILGINEPDN